MQRRRAVHAAGLGVVAALTLAGCGTDQQDAGEAWQHARAQIDGAESVRMTMASVNDSQGPSVVAWDVAGPLEGADGTTTGRMQVGRDSWMTVRSVSADGKTWARVDTEGQDVPEQIASMYRTDGWRETQQSGQNALRATLDAVGLPAADALDGVDVQPEKVDWSGGTAYRYAMPGDVASAARGDSQFSVRGFTVDEDGDLVGLRVEDGGVIQEFALSDWNEIEPAEAPEEAQH
ncbi:Tat (twin-arginine translocation) pathway signal sequence [Micrococcus porci]|uniref:Tat (twin-arginine translocation) pathway signal sequence n=1 Tax=Micrococcus porci TaxID=2856555 RepID=UPI003CF9CC8A